MLVKEHFNYKGMTKLTTLKNLTNYGLSDNLKKTFPDINNYLINKISYNFGSIPHEM